jgi:hypothetical protein
MRSIAAALLSFLLTPSLALAGETIATAPGTGSPPAAAPVSPLVEADAQGPDGAAGVRMGPCGPQAVSADGKADTRAHGFVEGGVGTGGYRHIAGGVCKPLANGGAIAVSVSESQANGRRFGP